MRSQLFRVCVAVMIAALLAAGPAAQAQNEGTAKTASSNPQRPDYSRGVSQFPNVFGPYRSIAVPQPVMTNSPRLEQLIREGELHLSLQDAISLALENNLDISVQRYAPWLADTDLLRAKAGFGSAIGRFDPQVTSTLSWDRRSTPINNPFLAGTGVVQTALTSQTSLANFQYSQGFPTGTSYTITMNNNRQSTTSPSTFLNPSVQSSLFFGFSQPLLNGFGFVANKRQLRIAANSRLAADLTFTEQVITTVSQVQTQYWDLVFAREDVKVKQRSVELADKLYADNKRQVEIGTLAPIEVVRAEAEVARTRQDLIVAQTLLLQQEMLLKNSITRNPMDPLLQRVAILPTDVIVAPPQIEILPLQDALAEALQKRPDVRRQAVDLETRGITVASSRNALLPTLNLNGQYGSVGLAGNARQTQPDGSILIVPAGLGRALDTAYLGHDFPAYSVSLNLTIPIRNRVAQADNARALLEQRQSETRLRQLQNNVAVEVRNAQIALEQNRARVQAAQKSRELAEQTLDAEQKKYQLGASTIFFVIQAQRDLAQAQSTEVRALTDLLKARVTFERALGRTLEAQNIQISDALKAEPAPARRTSAAVKGAVVGSSAKF
jgi:outer membrane protein